MTSPVLIVQVPLPAGVLLADAGSYSVRRHAASSLVAAAGAAARRRHGCRLQRATSKRTAPGKVERASLPFHSDLGRIYSIQRSGAGPGVDGISSTVHPRTVVEVPSPSGVSTGPPRGAV